MNRMTVILVVVAVLFGYGAASAATITQSQSFGFGLGGSTDLSFDQFDDQDGKRELNSVSLTLDGTVQASPIVTNAVDASNNVSVTLTGNIQAAGPSSLSALLFGLTVTTPTKTILPSSANGEYSFGKINASGEDTGTLTTKLSPYIGTGTLDVTVRSNGSLTMKKQYDAFLAGGKSSSGTVTLEYDYSAVP